MTRIFHFTAEVVVLLLVFSLRGYCVSNEDNLLAVFPGAGVWNVSLNDFESKYEKK